VYSVGLQALSSILVTTSDGLVLLDATFAETVDGVLESIRALGFDPARIRYVFITHARTDHYGGAGRIKQLVPSARVGMSLEDWVDAEREMRSAAGQQGSKPAPLNRDLIVSDGQRIAVGDTTFTFYVTPGTTPGALSIEYQARDGGTSYRAMSTGALGMYPEPKWGEAYIKSMQRLKTLGPWQV
jgi:metallo-beta-lactamase class B